MATHSSILAWRIPWTEEADELQSMRSQSWTQLKQLGTRAHTFLRMEHSFIKRKDVFASVVDCS